MVRDRQLLNLDDAQSWTYIQGRLQTGYGVASGWATHSPYPAGTIALQTPHFQQLGLDLTPYYPGTLNISIAPAQFRLLQPQWTFPLVHWFPASCPETFSFSPCQVIYLEQTIWGLIYYPHPETKPDHFQDSSTLEVLAPFIDEIKPDSSLQVGVLPQQIELVQL